MAEEVEKIKILILCSIIFSFEIVSFMRYCEKKSISEPRSHMWQYNTARVLCMLDN